MKRRSEWDTNHKDEPAKKCPECGSKLLRIVYGLPTEDAFKHAEERGLYFAGCCVNFFKYRCDKCKKNYTENLKENFLEDDDIFADKEDNE